MLESIESFYYRYLRYFLAKDDSTATAYDKYLALTYAVRTQMVDKWIQSQKYYHDHNIRRVYYLSMEYVFGKSLRQNIMNLGIEESVAQTASNLGFSLEEVFEKEDDFELGNGGKGRLAACYQDAMATLGIPGMAYGLRYDYALFKQEIHDGVQTERPYDWLHKGHPWEIVRPEYACRVGFFGKVENESGQRKWLPGDQAVAVPYDMPISGYKNDTVNTLRLWSARPSDEFLTDYYNHGDYVRACEEKSQSGRISKILFPDEDVRRATELRIRQQYFMISASLRDILRRFKAHNADIRDLDKKIVIQLNGSRCAIAVTELVRLLVDEEGLGWEVAWKLAKNIFAYTSHAVSRENLENWPVYLVEQILPRNMEIIYDINQRYLDGIRSREGCDQGMIRELSVVEEGEVKRIKMAHLAVLGSFAVNGVSVAQTQRLYERVFAPLSKSVKVDFRSITNGVAHRRWLLTANRPLASLITEAIGDGWTRNPEDLVRLTKYCGDNEFLYRLSDAKHTAKRRLAAALERTLGIAVDSNAFFDIQCKKIHPYKRQSLHILNIIWQYLRLKKDEDIGTQRVHLFSGKAAPSDHLAKQIIHLIHLAADVINNDTAAENKLKVIFIPNYGMSWAEYLIPAGDLSEQIATAGLEASGTSNMKFALNGALTIASWSGSNIEMIEKIGQDNLFVFGPTPENAASQRRQPGDIIANDPRLQEIFQFLEDLLPTAPGGQAIYPLLASLRDNDEFAVLHDFSEYIQMQTAIDELYVNRSEWLKKALCNIAYAGWFSSDRSIREYAAGIWGEKEQ
jgi:glycogen phosphorylase